MSGDGQDVIAAFDARDERLIAEGRFDELVAAYFRIIRQRCAVRIADRFDAEDAATLVVIRLLQQLQRGKRFKVPFRVVVHKRIDWEVRDAFGRRRRRRERFASLDSVAEPWEDDESLVAVLDRDEVERLVVTLPATDREILEMVYLDGLTIAQAAERLGITRNAADQRLFRARARLRESAGG
ncbi:MAG: sigma-70 family RNA polymerase sigma factor [Actinomycetota bacterium]